MIVYSCTHLVALPAPGQDVGLAKYLPASKDRSKFSTF